MVDYNDPEFKKQIRAQLDEKGEPQVRILMQSGGLPTHLNPIALEWLKEKNQETERLSAASQAEMGSAALRAATAAERAAEAAESQARTARHALITAIAATVIAAIALIVSIATALHFIV
jgi:hypothetical protein